MKGGSGFKIVLLLIVIAAAAFFSIDPVKEKINLGLDLQGGAQVLLQATPQGNEKISNEDMDKLTAVMRKRVDEFGVAEPVIQKQGNDRLIVELAGVDDPDQAIELLGRTAQLEFIDPMGTVVVTGADLKDARAQINANGENEILLEFTDDGKTSFGAATARLIGQPLGIYLDGALLQNPIVNSAIMDGFAVISGGFESFEAAANNAALLRGGALPVNIEILSKSTVGPSLGQDSLDKSLNAFMIGLTVLFVFMLVYYRLPGMIANISLVVYALLLLWAMSLLNVTLTLPGIAGFVLSLGMAVDCNIIIYERIKEELRSGKSLRASIDMGFKRAITTILDANITTLIVAVVLFQFGSGSIQGFALILAIGLLASLFTAITFTRLMLRWTSSIRALSKHSYYGVKEGRA